MQLQFAGDAQPSHKLECMSDKQTLAKAPAQVATAEVLI